MWKNKLLYIILFSFLIHGIFFSLLRPHFKRYKQDSSFLNWLGEFSYFSSGDDRVQTKYKYDDFFLEHRKRDTASLGKVISEQNKDVLMINKAEDKLFYEKDVQQDQGYTYIEQGQQISIDKSIFLDSDMPSWNQVYPLKKVSMEVLISPTGRVIATQKIDLKGHSLRERLEKEVRRLVFPSRKGYYWRSIEIKLR